MFNVRECLIDSIKESENNLRSMVQSNELHLQFEKMIELIVRSVKKGGGLFVAGNGGSAADAQHLVAELVVKLNKDRDPIKAFALTVDSSIITATGNDFSYDDIFSRQVEGLMNSNDVFLGISTSGNSKNILKAFQVCRSKGIASILLSGKTGGLIFNEKLADVNLIVPGENTARIQEAHEVLYHTLCYAVEKRLVDDKVISYR